MITIIRMKDFCSKSFKSYTISYYSSNLQFHDENFILMSETDIN